ncbi:hypothetical protein ONE63_000215 [Megalurothrips usitatus]|uniref:Fibroblast growth factor n=1 Tax=Megalurothrips usitatus TaxID=439358 RepID=A0AAV7Y4W6_9NEOP|nr:hypothetical protein ONE63_000215 [Megalurothrips usitatus]
MQGIATCLFLCMDACGLLYGSKELTDDCVFNEMLEQHYYNTYSSAKYSNGARSLYLALDRRGASRRVQLRRDAPRGRLAAYTRVLTKPVPGERVADLLGRLRGLGPAAGSGSGAVPHFRHRGHHAACPPHGHPEATPRRPQRCPRPGRHPATRPASREGPRVKPHQRRRPAPAAASVPGAAPRTPTSASPVAAPAAVSGAQPQQQLRPPRRKCEATEDEDLCHKRLQMIAAKKRKSRNEKKQWPHKRVKVAVKKASPTPSAPVPATTTAPTTTSATTTTSSTLAPTAVAPASPPGTATLPPPGALSASEGDPSDEEDHDGEEDDEDSVTMTTEVATTTVSIEEQGASAGGGAGAAGTAEGAGSSSTSSDDP